MNTYQDSIAEIAAELAHEVKNPLSLVRANIDLLELTDSNDSRAKNYRVMRRELTRINNLMTDFTRLSRPVTKTERVSLPRLMRQLIDDMRPALTNVSVYLDSEDAAPVVMGDGEALRRVFQNILKNAAESVEQTGRIDGEITADISVKTGFARVSVADNGAGCDDELLERINGRSPFRTTKPSGTGLGVYISRRIIEEHGGSLVYERNETGGLTAAVELPK
ncbi:MAG: GHKL domain-containing protein [Clostridiales bacterium]|jgi:signal transduction histidine kinase|nr:GHKL domain-containing protein [Clostridiales bacterium]